MTRPSARKPTVPQKGAGRLTARATIKKPRRTTSSSATAEKNAAPPMVSPPATTPYYVAFGAVHEKSRKKGAYPYKILGNLAKVQYESSLMGDTKRAVSASEVVFQAGKVVWFGNPLDEESMMDDMAGMTGMQAARYGRKLPLTLDDRVYWNRIRVTRMYEVLREKAERVKEVGDLLDAMPSGVQIVELSKRDRFWGCTPEWSSVQTASADRTGLNAMGVLWMIVKMERAGDHCDTAERYALKRCLGSHPEYTPAFERLLCNVLPTAKPAAQ